MYCRFLGQWDVDQERVLRGSLRLGSSITGQIMSLFNTTADEPSTLAKGIAKEKQLTRDLRIRFPNADITRTAPTGDGGKDIVVKRGGKMLYYEVKNWNQPMSSYDVRRYKTLHQNSLVDLKIYNQGGFSDGAQRLAEDSGIELISGYEYTVPRLSEYVRFLGIRSLRGSKQCVNRIETTASGVVQQVAHGPVGRTVKHTSIRLGRGFVQVGRWVVNRLSIAQLALVPALITPFWLIYRWWTDEYTHRDLVKALVVMFSSIVAYALLTSLKRR